MSQKLNYMNSLSNILIYVVLCAKYIIKSSNNILRISERVFVNYVMVLSCCWYLHRG